jgi:lysophospholipase L1-like esterase
MGWIRLAAAALSAYVGYRAVQASRSAPRPGRAAAVGNSIVSSPIFTRALNQMRGYQWDNHGVSGNSSAQMLARAGQWARPEYKEILIMGNLNDMSPRRSAAWTIVNLRNLYQRAKLTGARVVAVTSTPWKGYRSWSASEQRDQDEVNRWILAGADGIPDVVVNAYSSLESSPGSKELDRRWNGGDRLHLNRAGTERLVGTIMQSAYPDIEVM